MARFLSFLLALVAACRSQAPANPDDTRVLVLHPTGAEIARIRSQAPMPCGTVADALAGDGGSDPGCRRDARLDDLAVLFCGRVLGHAPGELVSPFEEQELRTCEEAGVHGDGGVGWAKIFIKLQ